MQELLIVAGAHLLAVMSPGPDLAIVLKTSISSSKRTAIYTALGIAIGVLFHLTYSIIGLAVIISQSIQLFNMIKIAGAAYLIWVGIKSLLTKKSNDTEKPEKVRSTTNWKAFKVGFLTNVLNPKATLFFLSMFTQVINPETSSIIKLGYGIEMTLVTFLWFSLVATIMTRDKVQNVFKAMKSWIDKIFGIVLIALGLKIAVN